MELLAATARSIMIRANAGLVANPPEALSMIFLRNMRLGHARFIIGPAFGQIKFAVDEGVAALVDITGENADLAIRDLARRARVLTPDAAGSLALFQEPRLVDDENRIVVGQRLQRIMAHDVAQRISVPEAATQNGLLPPRTGSPAASARIHPVLRRSSPSNPSRKFSADHATRACVNSGRIRRFTSRSDDPHNSSVVSIEAPDIP